MELFATILLIFCIATLLSTEVQCGNSVSDGIAEMKATMQKLGKIIEKTSANVPIASQKVSINNTLNPGDVTSVKTSVVFVQSGSRNYRVYKEPELNYEDAFSWCRERGMQLLTIESEEASLALEQVFVGNEAGEVYWTSGNDLAYPFAFVWKSTGNPFTFTKFYPSDPNDFGGMEKCVTAGRVRDDIGWYDQICEHKHKFVCERL